MATNTYTAKWKLEREAGGSFPYGRWRLEETGWLPVLNPFWKMILERDDKT